VSVLVGVGLSVPSSPDLEGSEHVTLAAHVTESTLSGSRGTRATDSWDTGDSATSSPGLSGVLLASEVPDSMGLNSVLRDVGVHELDNIISDRSSEHSGHGELANNVGAVSSVDGHNWAGGHLSC
jgi:hypothetical protein